jgi:hypothetical protein
MRHEAVTAIAKRRFIDQRHEEDRRQSETNILGYEIGEGRMKTRKLEDQEHTRLLDILLSRLPLPSRWEPLLNSSRRLTLPPRRVVTLDSSVLAALPPRWVVTLNGGLLAAFPERRPDAGGLVVALPVAALAFALTRATPARL